MLKSAMALVLRDDEPFSGDQVERISYVRFMFEYPLHSELEDGAWIDPANIAEFARVAEASGIDGIALTDHPAPSKKWLDHGGHETMDPFVGLGFLAAATKTIKLLTALCVVPYRNPFVTAKAMTAVDVLSGGRSIFVLGTGYLRSEFAALGVDFDERNELFDEAIEVITGVWTNDDFQYEGRHFQAYGVVMRPRPVQDPHPPLWLGGNAAIVRRRVAKWGTGWQPLLGDPTLARTTRTPMIENDEQLGERITEIKSWMADEGRDPSSLDVCAGSLSRSTNGGAEERIDQLGRLAEMGVTWTGVPFSHASFDRALDDLRRHGEEIAPKVAH
jgi:probable F420-dependent oxidoreductase